MIGGTNNDIPFAQQGNFDEENEIPQECWNTKLDRWINSERNDSGYQPKALTVDGNVIKTFYDGTEVPIFFKVEKLDTASEVWSAIMASTPAEYKLDKNRSENVLEWPSTVYRYYISQADDVLCRDEDYITYRMVAASVETLSSSNISESFYPSFFPEDVVVDEVNKRFTVNGLGTYEWALHQAPNDELYLRVIQIVSNLPENIEPNIDPSDYLIVNNEFVEVEINNAWDYDDFNDHLFITFDGDEDDFNQKIKSHFLQFTVR